MLEILVCSHYSFNIQFGGKILTKSIIIGKRFVYEDWLFYKIFFVHLYNIMKNLHLFFSGPTKQKIIIKYKRL